CRKGTQNDYGAASIRFQAVAAAIDSCGTAGYSPTAGPCLIDRKPKGLSSLSIESSGTGSIAVHSHRPSAATTATPAREDGAGCRKGTQNDYGAASIRFQAVAAAIDSCGTAGYSPTAGP